jgi:FAD/FMN-containing dehydrogenase
MSTRQTTDDVRIESIRIGPDDPRYLAAVDKRFNRRFSARPDYVRLVSSTDQVVSAVEEGVREGRRLVVTSGGHCLEGFVSDPEVRVIIDVSPMKRVYYDPDRGAVAVEAGATVGETFRALFERWGIVIPLGEYPEIGMGGHVVGGAFGFLCRQLGLAADYLYAVEVVTVDEDGRASSVVATREASDPHRDLWWAHTGGGGGNFGIVTRYWFHRRAHPATVPPRCCPARLSRSRPSGRNGTGATSTNRRSCDSSGITGSGASETVTPIPRTPRSGASSRSIVSSSGRSSSAV